MEGSAVRLRPRLVIARVVTLAAAVLAAAVAHAAAPPLRYDQAVAAFRALERGTPSARVIALAGEPTRRDERRWIWDFSSLKGYPGIGAGRQTFTAAVVTFDAAWRVERSELAWIDATGPAAPAPPRR